MNFTQLIALGLLAGGCLLEPLTGEGEVEEGASPEAEQAPDPDPETDGDPDPELVTEPDSDPAPEPNVDPPSTVDGTGCEPGTLDCDCKEDGACYGELVCLVGGCQAPPPGEPFGTPCDIGERCQGGYCVEKLAPAGGLVCSRSCSPGAPCPPDWVCGSRLYASKSGYICHPVPAPCHPCEDWQDCHPFDCLEGLAGKYCAGAGCEESDCSPGYRCIQDVCTPMACPSQPSGGEGG